MINTAYLRILFAEYLKNGSYEKAVNMATHIPSLLEAVDILQGALADCAKEAPKIQAEIQELQRVIEEMRVKA